MDHYYISPHFNYGICQSLNIRCNLMKRKLEKAIKCLTTVLTSGTWFRPFSVDGTLNGFFVSNSDVMRITFVDYCCREIGNLTKVSIHYPWNLRYRLRTH